MKTVIPKLIVVAFAMCSFWISCSDQNNPLLSIPIIMRTDSVATEAFSFDVAAVNQTQLRLEGINSEISVVGKSGLDSIIIRGEKRVGSETTQDAEAHLHEITISVQNQANEVFVKTLQPENTYGRSYVVQYVITLPNTLQVKVDNVNGTVTIDSINNLVDVDNVNGTVTLNKIAGSTHAHLTNGQIVAEVTLPLDGTIDMATSNGNIDLDIPQNTSATLSARVTNGGITATNLSLQSRVETSTSLYGICGGGRGTITLTTVNGSIVVTGS